MLKLLVEVPEPHITGPSLSSNSTSNSRFPLIQTQGGTKWAQVVGSLPRMRKTWTVWCPGLQHGLGWEVSHQKEKVSLYLGRHWVQQSRCLPAFQLWLHSQFQLHYWSAPEQGAGDSSSAGISTHMEVLNWVLGFWFGGAQPCLSEVFGEWPIDEICLSAFQINFQK